MARTSLRPQRRNVKEHILLRRCKSYALGTRGSRKHGARSPPVTVDDTQVNVRLAVFDMIGTTVRAGEEVPTAFFEAFRRSGLEVSDEAVSDVRGRSKAEVIASLVSAQMGDDPRVSETVETIYATFQKMLRESYATSAIPVPGAMKVLEGLMDAGVEVVLSTGLDRITAEGLLQGLEWFDAGVRLQT